jgi:predicted Zn-dependent protease
MAFNFARITATTLLVALLGVSAGLAQSNTQDKAETKTNQKQPKNSDIDNIGNRDINKRSINFMSLEKEVELGRQLAAELERSVKLQDDPTINEYVNRVGQNLVRNSDAKVPFTIKVIESDEVNAMALPGGFFYVNTGLIEAADDEAELAGVMAHEIAHVTARHGAENASKGQLIQYATIPLVIFGGPIVGTAARQGSELLIPMAYLKFSRGSEAEADYLGLQYMYKAGYDPTAALDFFEKLQAMDKAKPGTISKLFSSHPPTSDRIDKSKTNIASVLPDREQYVVTTSEFDRMKSRLLMLENQHASLPDDANRPSLRRRPAAPPDEGGDKTEPKDDDKPVLRRRPGN